MNAAVSVEQWDGLLSFEGVFGGAWARGVARLRLAGRVLAASVMAYSPGGCASPTDLPELTIESVLLEAVGDSARMTVGSARATPVWTSLNPEIFTVSSLGVVKGIAPGTGIVRVTSGQRSAEATVRVLPDAEVKVSFASLQPDGERQEQLTLQIVNFGGRGFYRLEAYRTSSSSAAERVMNETTETPAPVGLDVTFRTWLSAREDGSGRAADFVVVYTRPANAASFTSASCYRLHGEGPCWIP